MAIVCSPASSDSALVCLYLHFLEYLTMCDVKQEAAFHPLLLHMFSLILTFSRFGVNYIAVGGDGLRRQTQDT